MKERVILLFLVMAVLLACASPAAADDVIIGPGDPIGTTGMWDPTDSTTYILTDNLVMGPFDCLIINPGYTLKINSGITIYYFDTIDNRGTIDNYGTIDNLGGHTIENSDTINNYGTIDNYGTIYNGDTIYNYGTIRNGGIIYNYNPIYNYGIISDGIIYNSDTDPIYNYECGGSISPYYFDGLPIINVPNNAPILNPIGDREVNEGALLTITLSATDDDQNPLTYSTDATFGTLSGNVFTWTPGDGDAGSYDVKFSVSDGCEVGSETITITVNEVNDPENIPEFPTIAIPVIAVLGLAFIFRRRKD